MTYEDITDKLKFFLNYIKILYFNLVFLIPYRNVSLKHAMDHYISNCYFFEKKKKFLTFAPLFI